MNMRNIIYMFLAGFMLLNITMAYTTFQNPQNMQNYGYAIFNGTAYSNTNAGSMPKGSSARSVFGWIYPEAASGTIYSYGLLGSDELSSLYINDNGMLAFRGVSNGATSNFSISENKWIFVGYAYQSNSTNITFYYDGMNETVGLGAGKPLQTSGYAESSIGKEANCNGPCNNFVGYIADLRLYRTAINESDAEMLYLGGPTLGSKILYNNLAAWWPLNGSVLDYSGNGNGGSDYHIGYGDFSNLKALSVISGNGGGVIEMPGGGVYSFGKNVSLKAVAFSNYVFVNWSCTGSGCYSGNNPDPTIKMYGNITEMANFVMPVYLLNVAASPEIGGRIAIEANASLYSIKAQEMMEPYGSIVNFSEAPENGYVFVNWSCTGSGCYSGDYQNPEITVYGNVTETAKFRREMVNISVIASPANGGIVSGSGRYGAGSIVNLIAAADNGYRFNNWSCTGSGCYSGDMENFTINASGNIEEVANFVSSVNPGGISVSRSGTGVLQYYMIGILVLIIIVIVSASRIMRNKKAESEKAERKSDNRNQNGSMEKKVH
jgi:hypothetical protein